MLEMLLMRQTFFKAFGNLCCAEAMCPRRKEKPARLLFRVLAFLVLGGLACVCDDLLVFRMGLGTAVQPFICIAISLIYLILVRRMPPRQALYCTAWVNMSMEMGCQLFLILERSVIILLPPVVRPYVKLAGELATMALMFGLMRWASAKWLRREGQYQSSWQALLGVAMAMALFLVTTNYQFIFWLLSYEPQHQSAMIEAFRLVSGVMCLTMLSLQNSLERRRNTQQELEMMQQTFRRQQEQFRLSKENIDIINRKCHDLKHQIAALKTIRDQDEIDRQVEEMEQAVMIYDSVVRTGNPVLDVVLTEKSLYCEAHRINLTCLVDGQALAFVDTVDLYTLFGNALDNAIESVMRQQDKQKRVIQLASYVEKDMLLIRFRNYCDELPEMVDGMPVTIKPDRQYHGFGLKSIRYTAEKYGGGISIQTGTNTFTLQILLPLQPKDTNQKKA